MKIYTKTGDDGTTGLFGGKRVSKDAVRIESYGTVDELNSVIGIVRCHNSDSKVDSVLQKIQNDLFNLGADLATPVSVKSGHTVRMKLSDAEALEKWIDEMDADLPALTHFILPGGTPAASYLHLARNVCRRAERLTVTLAQKEKIGKAILIYLNRLSDLLFVMARWSNHNAGREEMKWTKADR